MRRPLASAAIAAALAFAVAGAAPRTAAAQTTLKLATLAPEGSSWMKLFREWGSALEKRTGGQIKVKFYAGGVAGDERDAVRKMKLGQLNGAAVTAVGLGLIQPEVRMLEVPFLVKDYAELDHIRNTFDAEIRKKFEEKGYVLLNWGDVGPVHLFTNLPVKSLEDLRQTKMWAWTDDPIVKTLFSDMKLSGVPLGVPDVLPSLQTGMINACYGSPLSTVALQWHSKIKYITSMVFSQAIGATVITKATFDKLPPDQQAALLDESKKMEAKVLTQIRADNTSSLKKMESLGIQVVPTPPAVIAEFEKTARGLADKLAGQLYSKDFHGRVEKAVVDYRAGKGGKK